MFGEHIKKQLACMRRFRIVQPKLEAQYLREAVAVFSLERIQSIDLKSFLCELGAYYMIHLMQVARSRREAGSK